jgi:hypothetical protein
MASTTGPDLTTAQESVERLQDDACIITRTSAAAVLNQVTGKMEYPPPATIYNAASTGEGGRSLADSDGTGGRCSINYPSNTQPSYREEGGRQILRSVLEAKLPIDAPLIREGDILTVVSSRRDPQLVNQVFRVSDVIEKSMAVSRRLVLEKR